MIRYALRCDRDHVFDAWFQSAAAFETLRASGMTTCAICGSAQVEKTLMAPPVQASRGPDRAASEPAPLPAPAPGPATGACALSEPEGPLAQAIARLRAEVEANSEYVGKEFATQARAMHLGEATDRAIHGEARLEDAKALIDEGVPVLPLPFSNRTKSN